MLRNVLELNAKQKCQGSITQTRITKPLQVIKMQLNQTQYSSTLTSKLKKESRKQNIQQKEKFFAFLSI